MFISKKIILKNLKRITGKKINLPFDFRKKHYTYYYYADDNYELPNGAFEILIFNNLDFIKSYINKKACCPLKFYGYTIKNNYITFYCTPRYVNYYASFDLIFKFNKDLKSLIFKDVVENYEYSEDEENFVGLSEPVFSICINQKNN